MRRTRVLGGLGLVSALLLLWASPAGAQDATAEEVEAVRTQINVLWLVIGAVLVIFMQAGFALVETGFCRAKHAAHVVSTNFAVFGLGFVAFFIVGYGIMFGGFYYDFPGVNFGYLEPVGDKLLAVGDWVIAWKGPLALSGKAGGAAVAAYFLYMVAFMDTTATIPTGAMAERWKWKAFVGWGLFCGAIFYPLFGAMTWGGGWLSQLGNNLDLGLGYTDFAGSGVVHAMGGIAGLAGAVVLGPRIGKFAKDGTPRALPGHHIPMAMLGTFILLFGWFGFNAASTFAATDVQLAVVATNTAIAAAFGATIAMFWIWKRTGKPDPAMMANGMLAGLVAITAPCAFVDPWAAMVIGSVAAVLVVESVFFIERKLKVDDPVGAISVHGVCGIFGVLAVGIFANGKYGTLAEGVGWNGTATSNTNVTGIIKGMENLDQLAAQAIGAAVIIVGFGLLAYAFFKIQNALMKGGIRAEEEHEIAGLDLPEMGVLAYPEFTQAHTGYVSAGTGAPVSSPTV